MMYRPASNSGNLKQFRVLAKSGMKHGRTTHGERVAVRRGSPGAMIRRPTCSIGASAIQVRHFSGDVRPGDNLFTDSVIALHASTGKLAWYFQFTPHDEHDWDSAQTPVLADLPIDGVVRKVICWPNRNGFYYVLDRVTGEFLAGVPFVQVDWAKGLTSAGRPILADVAKVSTAGSRTRPGAGGGTNWQNPAFDPEARIDIRSGNREQFSLHETPSG